MKLKKLWNSLALSSIWNFFFNNDNDKVLTNRGRDILDKGPVMHPIQKKTDRPMKTQHSPGPWTEWQSGIFDVDGNIIATVSQDGQWNWIEGSNVECAPGEANARLIAAAPELLEALSECLGQLEQLHYLYESCEFSERIEAADEAAKRAKKLIAKLTDE